MAETRTPVEVTTRYATTVDDLPAAWAFVMAKVDLVGPAPSVEISPRWQSDYSVPHMLETGDEGQWTRVFEVVVSGMVEEAP